VGSDIYLHDFEVINASSRNNILIGADHENNIEDAGTNLLIERITCSNIGDDPNHVWHDASFIYVVMDGYTVRDCHLTAHRAKPTAAESAIECHGSNYTVENNTITNFHGGLGICGISNIVAENVKILNNTVTDCVGGMYIFSSKFGSHTTGYGLDGVLIDGNTINALPFANGETTDRDARRGITIWDTNDLDINDLTISDNTITVDSLEVASTGYNMRSHAIGHMGANTITLSNSVITNNRVTNFPTPGVCFYGCGIDNVSVTDNTLSDCGSTMHDDASYMWKVPVLIDTCTIDTLDISNNTFIDDIGVTRIPHVVEIWTPSGSPSGFTIQDNMFTISGDKSGFTRHVNIEDNNTKPLITGRIDGFVPPTQKVAVASRVTDGSYIWVVGPDGLTWTKSMPSISPTRGPVKTTVTIKGSGFGKNRSGNSGDGSNCVTFNGTQASDYPEWSDTEIQAVVQEGTALGPAAVVVVVGGAPSNTENTFTVTPTASSFYFAEGYTGENFAEYLCIGNPNNAAATATVTYMFSDGTTIPASYNVPANSRYTVNVNSEVGAGKEVSIRVLSDTANLVAERPMYFNYNGAWTGGSVAVGAASPAKNWYFAEGNTQEGFDQYVTVLNPGGTVANLTFRYMVEGQGEVPVSARVNPNTRATFKTRDQIGSGKNTSLCLESDQNVVAERPMYFNYQGLASNNWTGGHVVVGTYSPAKDWYFAEGTTRSGFEEWLCLQNPGSEPITVKATYQLGPNQGDPVQKSYTVPARQRLTVPVNVELGAEKDNSVHLSSTADFVAERPMYFDYQGVWDGGHDVLGANTPATTWFFADGYTGDNFNEWLCLQNPGTDAAHVTITYYPTSGAPISKPWTVAPNSRLTVNVNDDAGSVREISTKVSSDNPIIAERPMYFAYQGAWTGGHDVVGFVPSL
jgi:hypothetical protein